MSRTWIRRVLPLAAVALLPVSILHAQDNRRGRKYKPPPPTCKITVTVVKARDGKPVQNASVVFHPIRNNKDEGNMELKTNEDGKTSLDVIPIGDTVRVQVIAEGYRTFGNDYPLPSGTRDIVIKLRLPSEQYSIYDNQSEQSASGQSGSQTGTPRNPPH